METVAPHLLVGSDDRAGRIGSGRCCGRPPRFRSRVTDITKAVPKDSERLADTPFAAMPDPPVRPPLTKPERLNVVFVVAASQLVQILIVAMVTATIFFILGLILLSPPLLAQWTNHGTSKGTLLGMTLPLPEALIQMSLFLAAAM